MSPSRSWSLAARCSRFCSGSRSSNREKGEMKARPTLLSLVVATATLAGCADMQGVNHQSSLDDANALAASKTLAGATTSPAAWPTSDWWRAFKDPQLDRLIDQALIDSPTLRIAEARTREALAFAAS